jgi:hypothetical protein
MAWLDGVPQKRLGFVGNRLDPKACVMHRTIGRWGGDQAVLERSRVPSVHFLVGQADGQWWQYYDTTTTTAHAAGANSYAVGIEFSGQNSDLEELTRWQIQAGAHIVRELNRVHQIPLVFLESGPRVAEFRGFLNHSNVETEPQYTHHDFITKDAWDRMVSGQEEDDLPYTHEDLIARAQDGVKRALDEEAVQTQIKLMVARAVLDTLKTDEAKKAIHEAIK